MFAQTVITQWSRGTGAHGVDDAGGQGVAFAESGSLLERLLECRWLMWDRKIMLTYTSSTSASSAESHRRRPDLAVKWISGAMY